MQNHTHKKRSPKKSPQQNFPPYGSAGFSAVLVLGILLPLLFCPENVTVQQNPASICSSKIRGANGSTFSDKQDRQGALMNNNSLAIQRQRNI